MRDQDQTDTLVRGKTGQTGKPQGFDDSQFQATQRSIQAAIAEHGVEFVLAGIVLDPTWAKGYYGQN